jgi:hypothetical protein
MSSPAVLKRMDEIVDAFCKRNRFQSEPLTQGRARTFVRQHCMNTRRRNSVLKLKVATNIPDWEMKLKIIKACSQEIIADNEFGHGEPLGMEDDVIHALDVNLRVWEMYFNGICDAGDRAGA